MKLINKVKQNKNIIIVVIILLAGFSILFYIQNKQNQLLGKLIKISESTGTSIQEVNRLLKQFEEMKKMMKQMTGMAQGKGKKKMKLPGFDSLFK